MEEEREGGRVRERDIPPRQLVFFVTRGMPCSPCPARPTFFDPQQLALAPPCPAR